MENVKVKFTQFSKRANKEIGFIAEDSSDKPINILQIKWWATILLYKWFKQHELNGIKTFYKNIPIKIEAYINSELVAIFMQIRVTKDTIIHKEKDLIFPFLENDYLLVNFKESQKKNKIINIEKARRKNFKSERFLNTIEYFAQDFPRLGSPIIFSGWTI